MIYTLVSMGAMALAVLAGSPVTFTGLDAKEGPHAAMMMKCATTCSACAVECDGCFHHCASLVSDGKKEHATCMCEVLPQLCCGMLRHGQDDPEVICLETVARKGSLPRQI